MQGAAEGRVPRRELDVLYERCVIASKVTDGAGVAEIVLTQGRYKLRVGTIEENVYVAGDTTTPCKVKLEHEDLPDEEGTLAVSVVDEDGKPAPGEPVLVSGPSIVEAEYTNASGVAAFALSPGDYTIEVDEQSVRATVYAGGTRWVQLEV